MKTNLSSSFRHPLHLTLIVGLLLGASIAPAVEARLEMDAFTSSTAGETSNTYGANGNAAVNEIRINAAGKKGWLKFDVAGALPAGVTHAHITKATLRLFATTVTTAGTMEVKAIGNNGSAWNELTITHTNSSAYTLLNDPVTNLPYATRTIATADLNDFVDLVVTDLVKDWLDGTQANYGLALLGTNSLVAFFASKEEGGKSQAPKLIIEYATPRVPAKGDVSMGTFVNGPQP